MRRFDPANLVLDLGRVLLFMDVLPLANPDLDLDLDFDLDNKFEVRLDKEDDAAHDEQFFIFVFFSICYVQTFTLYTT
jgi:hypothetical protein